MDVAALSLKMKRLTIWLDRRCRGERTIKGHARAIVSNLRRAGFEASYDKEVYEWRAADLAD
jgi:hypothetical protein